MSSTPRTRNAPGSVWSWLLIALVVVGLALTVVSGAYNALFPPPASSDHGHEIRDLYDIVFWLAAIIFFIVEGLILWTVVRYRRKPGDDELPPQTHGSNLAEITWTLIPTIIVAFLFFVSWQTLNKVEAVSANPPVRVDVTGSQFAWTFDYVDANDKSLFKKTIANGEGPDVVLPVGQAVQIRLHSVDVIHSFYVPTFLFKRDANPDATGRRNVFEFTIDPQYAGQVIRGQCAELCGIGHHKMLFSIHPVTATDYAAWRQQQIEKAQATPAPSGPAASLPAGATTLQVAAKDIAFDTKELSVAAGQPFAIDFKNEDPAGVPHDIEIRGQDGSVLQGTEPIDGGQTTTYTYQPLQAGTYTFICTIHPIPAMTGTLTVK